MTFRDYFLTLYNTECFGTNQATMVKRFFEKAGAVGRISDSAAKSWIREKDPRKCKTSSYFSDETPMQDERLIAFLMEKTSTSWKSLQESFCKLNNAAPADEGFCVNVSTQNVDEFYWSLLNQFQRILHLAESERAATPSIQPAQSLSIRAHDHILKALKHYQIMEIINRRPALLSRYDSADLGIFLGHAETVLEYKNSLDLTLYSLIKQFHNETMLQKLIIDATMNSYFGFDNDDAVINMDEGEIPVENASNPNKQNLPELTPKLFETAKDPVGLHCVDTKTWNQFRNIANHIYNQIVSWHPPHENLNTP